MSVETAEHNIATNESPLVTFAIISFNQEGYIREAVESALAQTYSYLEIIISDDCSSDRTFQIIEEVVGNYSGNHTVSLNRNPINIGLGAHVNKVWELATGELLILQAGDDISLSHRTSTLVDAWMSHVPAPDLVFSSVKLINENGMEIGERSDVIVPNNALKDSITGKCEYVTGGCCSAYSKSVHWRTGPIREDCIAEDYIYTFRAMLGNGIIGIQEPLVLYRQHDESIMGKGRNKTRDKRRNVVGRYSRLLEYKKAMDAYGFARPYLRWRLNRRIHTFELALQVLDSGVVERISVGIQAILTLRVGLILDALKYIFR